MNAYTPPTLGTGVLTVNTAAYVLQPGVVVSGAPITVGAGMCFAVTFNAALQIAAIQATSNTAGTPYVCGAVSQYTPGYTPYSGYTIPGGAPTTGTTYGPYPATGAGSGYYAYGGPIVISGYPYYVPSTTTFPYSPQYGNNYCFTVGQQGAVTGSLSVVPTAAHAVEEGGSYRQGTEYVS